MANQEFTDTMYGVGFNVSRDGRKIVIEFDTTFEGWETTKHPERGTVTEDSIDPQKRKTAEMMLDKIQGMSMGFTPTPLKSPLATVLELAPPEGTEADKLADSVFALMQQFANQYREGIKPLGPIPVPKGTVKPNPALSTTGNYSHTSSLTNTETKTWVDTQPGHIQRLLKSVKEVLPDVTQEQLDTLRDKFKADLGRGRNGV